jgi:hypothetical protein
MRVEKLWRVSTVIEDWSSYSTSLSPKEQNVYFTEESEAKDYFERCINDCYRNHTIGDAKTTENTFKAFIPNKTLHIAIHLYLSDIPK